MEFILDTIGWGQMRSFSTDVISAQDVMSAQQHASEGADEVATAGKAACNAGRGMWIQKI